MNGYIFDIKEMAVHDGPGIRTTVFLKGCPLHCQWCHNPEGLSFKPQLMYKQTKCRACNLCYQPCNHDDCKAYGRCLHICPEGCLEIVGKETGAVELAAELKKTATVLVDTFGGFTFSGGEPLAQPNFLLELMEELKDYHLCIETSGYADSKVFREVISKLDYVIMDIKLADSALHKMYTGFGNEKILQNFEILRQSGKPYRIRTPLIPDITDTDDNLNAIKKLIGQSEWEQLPYNELAGAKYPFLSMTYPL